MRCGERVSLSVGECSLSCVTLEDRAVLLTNSSLCDAESLIFYRNIHCNTVRAPVDLLLLGNGDSLQSDNMI